LATNDRLVQDLATGLMWQRSGSKDEVSYTSASAYVDSLNRADYGGFSSWRLPTLEEAMSLMGPQPNENGLYIDPVFENQPWIWTADMESAARAWYVNFLNGYCVSLDIDVVIIHVRAVR